MLYLLDANVLINAKNEYYQFDRVPEFWDWLVFQGETGNIKIPSQIYDEFKDTKNREGKKDNLADWAAQDEVKSALLLNEDVVPLNLNRVISEGYQIETVTDEDLDIMGKDPFLIAFALEDIGQRSVVTTEVSKTTQKYAKSKVPDVCDRLGINHIKPVNLINLLDFRTNFSR